MRHKRLLVILLFLLIGCQQEKSEWNPIFEKTNFNYFSVNVERSLALLEDAYSEAGKNKQESIQEKLLEARDRLLEIKDYYVPLTTIRQKIYDSERYYKLKDVKESKKLLEDAKLMLTALEATTKSEAYDKVILDLDTKIHEVLLSLDGGSTLNTYNRMKLLGEHVNLMLYRGDLVLSGIRFDK
jgi:hypothetical protein